MEHLRISLKFLENGAQSRLLSSTAPNNMLTITTSGSSTVLVFRIYIIENTMIWTAGGAGITLTRVE